MSNKIQADMWNVQFPTVAQKIVAVKLADLASDNGKGIWPSMDFLVFQSNMNRRSVQRVMRQFEEVGLIMRKAGEAGGRGGSNNWWDMDVEMLDKLASRKCHLIGDSQTLELVTGEPVDMLCAKGDEKPPLEKSTAAETTNKGGIHDQQGRSVAAQNPNEPKRTASSARERASGGDANFNLNWICEEYGIGLDDVQSWSIELIDKHGQDAFDAAVTEYRTKADTGEISKPGLATIATFVASYTPPAKKKSKLDAFAKGKADTRPPTFTILRTDPPWPAWMKHLAVVDEDVFATVQRTGVLETSTRWPNPSSIVHTKANNPTNDADRITGDVDR